MIWTNTQAAWDLSDGGIAKRMYKVKAFRPAGRRLPTEILAVSYFGEFYSKTTNHFFHFTNVKKKQRSSKKHGSTQITNTRLTAGSVDESLMPAKLKSKNIYPIQKANANRLKIRISILIIYPKNICASFRSSPNPQNQTDYRESDNKRKRQRR